MPRFQILPAEVKFFDLFEAASGNLLDAAEALRELMERYQTPEAKVEHLTELEHHGDHIVHEIFDLLHTTLVTPIDAEEIRGLAQTVDDALDMIEHAARLMVIYQVERPSDGALVLANLVVRGAREIHAVMPLLRDKKYLREARQRAIEIDTIENEADTALEDGLRHLVSTSRDDWFEFTRWHEIYQALEEATDRYEDVADIVQTVVLKNE